jgi:type IV pilus assembly protein PilE
MGTLMKKNLGFTLIEVMIVIAIISILSAFAIANYSQYVRKAERKEVQTEMLEIAARLEQYYALNNSYVLNNVITQPGVPRTSQNGKYEIEVFENSQDKPTPTELTFKIEAKAKAGSSALQDKEGTVVCTPLTLNSVTTKMPIECWD